MSAAPETGYPLTWPVGWKRTDSYRRRVGPFGTGTTAGSKQSITLSKALDRLFDELRRLGVRPDDVVVSCDLRMRLDGRPYSSQAQPKDPGVAVYWTIGKHKRCMAIDIYTKVEQNIAALAASIEAMRAIERHGGAVVMERAFTGFTALPAPIVAGMRRPWREVLQEGHHKMRTLGDVEYAYRVLAQIHHPDRGGSHEKMAELNAARDEALKELTE